MENITEVNYELIKEIKDDLEKRVWFLEKTCIECTEPLRKELKLINELEWYIQHLEHENRVYKTDVQHAAKVVKDYCKNQEDCGNCIFHYTIGPFGYCKLADYMDPPRPECWDV